MNESYIYSYTLSPLNRIKCEIVCCSDTRFILFTFWNSFGGGEGKTDPSSYLWISYVIMQLDTVLYPAIGFENDLEMA